MTIRFLDVGQGDSILITSPDNKNFLIDGGRSSVRMEELLHQYKIKNLEAIVATHADFDHIAGLDVAAKLKPKYFYHNGLGGHTKTWLALQKTLQKNNVQPVKVDGQHIKLGSVNINLVSPPNHMGDDQNNNSVGAIIEFGYFRALMTGDSEHEETSGWLSENPEPFKGDFQAYKSIHHGAANGDHQAWIDHVKPQNVIISVGKNNYGHPTDKALDLYKKNNIKVYRTDKKGTITFTATSDGQYQVHTEKK